MKVRSIPVVFFLLLVASSLVGQDIDSVKPRPVYDVAIISGGASGNSSIFGLNDFRKIYPASSILKRDLSGFSGYGENYFSEYFGFGVMVGRTSRQMRVLGERVKGTLRAGFYYDEASYFSYTLTDGSNTRVDTIKNSQGVSQFYIDSAYYKTASMYYDAKSLRAEVSALLRFNDEQRWSFYLGVGLSAGMTFNNSVNVSYSEQEVIETYPAEGLSGTSATKVEFPVYENDQSAVSSGWVVNAFVPLGIDFRLAKTGRSLEFMHLFTEVRPGISFMEIPDVRTVSGTQVSFHLGLRCTLN